MVNFKIKILYFVELFFTEKMHYIKMHITIQLFFLSQINDTRAYNTHFIIYTLCIEKIN